MAVLPIGVRSYPYAAELRRELCVRNLCFAQKYGLPHRESYGQPPVICYLPSSDGSEHGNFIRESYQSILRNENWRGRLEKVHTQARSSLPREERRWRELDSCNSSDALLMNIFCHPGAPRSERLFDLLGISKSAKPEFGVRARVPLANGRFDRTEVDMRIGDLLVEAKLTESDFQSCEEKLVRSYRDLEVVFEIDELPQMNGRFISYQLIRNVLAAHALGNSFCVISDERRPDLKEAWYAVMTAIRPADLRVRCKMITWQELSEVLPRKLRMFLAEKYGIATGDVEAPALFEAQSA
jgi:hypothetical protein